MPRKATGSSTPTARPGRRSGGLPTWAKLWIVVILANAIGMFVAVWVAGLVRAVPASESVELMLRLGYYATMLIIAFIEALLIDEVMFGGGFRKTHLQGRTARYARPDDDVQEVAASMQRSSTSFPFLILVCAGVTYLLFNAINHDFDTYYRRVGKHVSAMHYAEPAKQLDAIAALSIRREPEILPTMRWALAQGGDRGRWGAWALGRFRDLPSRRPLHAPLVAASRGDDPAVRREALVALGRLQHRSMAPQIQAELTAQLDAGEPADLRLLYGLGATQVMSSLPVLERILHHGGDDETRMAAWALAQHRDQVGGRVVVGMLEDRLPSASAPLRCAIVHSLGILADETSNLAIMAAYDNAPAAERDVLCSSIDVQMRPDLADDPERLLMPAETFGMKVIKAMGQMRATSSEIRTKVEPWLAALIADPNTPVATREAAHGLAQGIQSGRDDNERPTVDEAIDQAMNR